MLLQRDQDIAAENLLAVFKAHKLGQRYQHIACYFPADGEINLFPLMQYLWRQNKHCYLPVIGRPFDKTLRFSLFNKDTCLHLNRFGIPEPEQSQRRLRRTFALDLVLMPLVAFDCKGNRIGMGGGFYDRTLAFLAQRQHFLKPDVMGVAHDFQRVSKIVREDWDVRMQSVLTDKKLYLCDEEA